MLSNVIYTCQVNHKGTFYPGEHPQIVDPTVWGKVDERLRHNGITGGKEVRNEYGALSARAPAMRRLRDRHGASLKGSRRYRYYVCLTAQQRG